MWEIEVTAAPPLPPGSPLTAAIPERKCTPLRPGYAVDLRDAALTAVGTGPDAWIGTQPLAGLHPWPSMCGDPASTPQMSIWPLPLVQTPP